MSTLIRSILALDVGGKRVGVAIASLEARLPQPLTTLTMDENIFAQLQQIVAAHNISVLVIGLPRGLQGQHTEQTKAVEAFAGQLGEHFSLPIHFQDEAVTSKQAEAELESRGKDYVRGDIDALAATYILQDWLSEQSGEAN